MFVKCVLTIPELNWYERFGDKKEKKNLSSSAQIVGSFHVVKRTRMASKCTEMKNTRAKRAKRAKFVVKYANL